MKAMITKSPKENKTRLAKKLGVSRGMLYYQHKRPLADEDLKQEIVEVLKKHPAYGHKRIALAHVVKSTNPVLDKTAPEISGSCFYDILA